MTSWSVSGTFQCFYELFIPVVFLEEAVFVGVAFTYNIKIGVSVLFLRHLFQKGLLLSHSDCGLTTFYGYIGCEKRKGGGYR